MTSALGPIRILDFSRVLAGPLATMVLADLGADVIKVERPVVGDDTRQWQPPVDARGRSTYFEAVNRNKRTLALDLRDPADVAFARDLARQSDVLVENFRPGVMDRLGLGYEDLRQSNDRLIYTSITGFGSRDGATLPGYDLLVQAMGGLMSITGAPDGEPQKVGVALVDVIAGLFSAIGILAAIQRRQTSGTGQKVEVDLLSSLLAGLVNQASAFTVGDVVPARMGNAHPSIAPYELFPCRDGEIVVAVGTDGQFKAMCDLLPDGETLAGDPRFRTNADRVEHRVELRQELAGRLAARDGAEWVEAFSAAGVPAGLVNDIAAAFRFATELGLDPIVEVPDEDGYQVPLTRNPINLSESPATYRTAPPAKPERDPEQRPGWSEGAP